ncbi:hypothetical protein Csa_022371 [Cucumis sativus]|nr:hypothetical protein Csa_022371 [Cucumis sativus]
MSGEATLIFFIRTPEKAKIGVQENGGCLVRSVETLPWGSGVVQWWRRRMARSGCRVGISPSPGRGDAHQTTLQISTPPLNSRMIYIHI